MKILHLTLKKQWFDMIDSGEKKEEYRDINPYWSKRFLCDVSYHHTIPEPSLQQVCDFIKEGSDLLAYNLDIPAKIKFARGGHFHPSIPQIIVESKGIAVGCGRPEWGAEPGKKYFVIKLGERL